MKVKHTFSEQIKKELCSYVYETHSMKAILSSFLSNNLTIHFDDGEELWEIRTQFMPILKLFNNFFTELYNVKKEMSFTEVQKLNNRRIYRLMVQGNFQQINSDLEINNALPLHLLNSTENKRAYLVGAFLSGGSINSIEGSNHHLEIRSTKVNYLRLIQKLLHEFNISMSLLQRKNIYILYIKKNIEISDFLKVIGANEAMQEWEEKIISRDYYNNVNKLNNLDIANLRKTSSAGIEQVRMINAIRKTKFFKEQPDKFRFYCSLRLQNPEAPLSEMVNIFQKKYQIKITRTGINHYVLKIRKIFNKVK